MYRGTYILDAIILCSHLTGIKIDPIGNNIYQKDIISGSQPSPSIHLPFFNYFVPTWGTLQQYKCFFIPLVSPSILFPRS